MAACHPSDPPYLYAVSASRPFRALSLLGSLGLAVLGLETTLAKNSNAVAASKSSKASRSPVKATPKGVKFNVDAPTAAPEFAVGGTWINSKSQTLADLRGKVVLVNFWTFGCINCQRTLPHVKELYAKYHAKGFEIVGIHSPEFDYEKEIDNVRKAVDDEGITWPVLQDNGFTTWKRYRNRYWPAFYYVDRAGKVRHFHAGEGAYLEQDKVVAALLAEATSVASP